MHDTNGCIPPHYSPLTPPATPKKSPRVPSQGEGQAPCQVQGLSYHRRQTPRDGLKFSFPVSFIFLYISQESGSLIILLLIFIYYSTETNLLRMLYLSFQVKDFFLYFIGVLRLAHEYFTYSTVSSIMVRGNREVPRGNQGRPFTNCRVTCLQSAGFELIAAVSGDLSEIILGLLLVVQIHYFGDCSAGYM